MDYLRDARWQRAHTRMLAAQRDYLLAEIAGDGEVRPPWRPEQSWMTLMEEAGAALRRTELLTAETQARAALAAARSEHGNEHPFVTDPMCRLAEVLIARRELLDEAVDLLDAGITLLDRRFPDSPQLVKLLVQRARVSGDEATETVVRARIPVLRTMHRFDEIESLRPSS